MKLTDLRQLAARLSGDGTGADPRQIQQILQEMGYDPANLYQELEMSSRLVDTHRDFSNSNTQVQLHSHTFYELLYCRTSCGAEYLVGTERYRLQRGDIVFIPPGVSHRPLLPEDMDGPYERYVLWLSPEFVRSYIQLFPNPRGRDYPGVLRTAGTRWEGVAELFRAGVWEAEHRKEGWEAAVVGNAIILLTQIGRAVVECSAPAMEAEQPELLDRIASYIEGHYTGPINIGDIARHFYVSGSTVSHLFKEKMGVSLYRYVTQRRLIAAKTLIEEGHPLEAVSASAGFSDYSAFYRAFRQEFGISPRQYRAMRDPGAKSRR